jgi:hypothetical protein
MGVFKKAVTEVKRQVNVKAASKTAKKILADEVEKPRKAGRDGNNFVTGLGQRIGFAGIVAFTVGAALLGSVAGCKVPGQPEPRPTYSEDADKPDYQCGYDGNQKCPSTPPPVRASCDEPASWCHRGDAAEAVQR